MRHKHKRKLVKCGASTDSEEEETLGNSCVAIQQTENKVFFYAQVTKSMILKFITKLKCACDYAIEKKQENVFVYIHSDGGDLYAGLSAMGHIKSACVGVVTVVDAYAASAATLMFMGGVRRVMYPQSRLLLHQPRTTFEGTHSDMLDEHYNCSDLLSTMKNIYLEYSSYTHDELDDVLKHEKNINAADCIFRKLATSVEYI